MSRRYHPIVRVGIGALADVYFGVLESAAGIRRPIIIKRAYADYSTEHPEAVAALTREARYATALLHPNVVQAYELTETEEGLILAMEYVPGLSVQSVLEHMLQVGDIVEWKLACRIVADAASGFAHIHKCRIGGVEIGLVHGDPSPSNLLVSETGSTRIVDFGAARSREDPDNLPMMGTLGYCSPEQLHGRRLDARSDVFGLGCVLYHLLSGTSPFQRGSEEETVSATLQGELGAIQSEAPTAVKDLVRRMLIVDPARRVVTMSEAAKLLGAAAGSAGSTANVAKWLRMELGDRLRTRAERLEELIGGERRVSATTHQATWTYVEHSLDAGQLTQSGRPRRRDPSDTKIDR